MDVVSHFDYRSHDLRFGDLTLATTCGVHVTPALHTPLMAVTNAISAIIIVGGMLAAALTETWTGKLLGTLAVALAAVNVFGGFMVTRRMLEMYQKKSPPAAGKKTSYKEFAR